MRDVLRPVLFVFGLYAVLVVLAGVLTSRGPSPEPSIALLLSSLAGGALVLTHIIVTIALEWFASRRGGEVEALRQQAVGLFASVSAFAILSLAGTGLFFLGLMEDSRPALVGFVQTALSAHLPSLVVSLIAGLIYLLAFVALCFFALRAFRKTTEPNPDLAAIKKAEAEALAATERQEHGQQKAKILRARVEWLKREAVLRQERLRALAHILFAFQLFFMFPAAVKIVDLVELLLLAPFLVIVLIGAASAAITAGLSWFFWWPFSAPEPVFSEREREDDATKPSEEKEQDTDRDRNSFFAALPSPDGLIRLLALAGFLGAVGVGAWYVWPQVFPPEAPIEDPISDAPEQVEPSETMPPLEPGLSPEPPSEPGLSPELPEDASDQRRGPLLRPLGFDRSLPEWAYDSARDVVDSAGTTVALRSWGGVILSQECDRIGGLLAIGLASYEGSRTYNLELSAQRAAETRQFALQAWQNECSVAPPEVQLVIARGKHRQASDRSSEQRPVVILAIESVDMERIGSPEDLIRDLNIDAVSGHYLDCDALVGSSETGVLSGASVCEAIIAAQTGL